MVALAEPWRRHSAFRIPHSALRADAWDRLVKVHADDGQGGQGDLVATYSYDGARRRTRRAVEGAPDVAYDYFYSGYQAIEVRKDQSASPYEQYVWGVRYVHSPVCRWYDADADGQGVVLHYYLNDANFNVTALIESDGDVAERIAYDPYGKATFYDEDWQNPSGQSAVANTVLFTGHRLDPETGCYYAGVRYCHPTLGRWLSRDPVGYADGVTLYESNASNPVALADPTGSESQAAGYPPIKPRLPTLQWWSPEILAPANEPAFAPYLTAPGANKAVKDALRDKLNKEHPKKEHVIGAIAPFRDEKGLFGQAALFYGYALEVGILKYDGKCYCDFSRSAFYYKAAVRYDARITSNFMHQATRKVVAATAPGHTYEYVDIMETTLLEHELMHVHGTQALVRAARAKGIILHAYKGWSSVADEAIKWTREHLEWKLKYGYDTEDKAKRGCSEVMKSALSPQGKLRSPEEFLKHGAFHYMPTKDPFKVPLRMGAPGSE